MPRHSRSSGLWPLLLLLALSVASGHANEPASPWSQLPLKEYVARLNAAVLADRQANQSDISGESLQPLLAVDDDLLLRRLYLTLAGRIPTVAEQEQYRRQLAENPQATQALVETLLAGPGWVRCSHWWEDQLRVTSMLTRRTSGEPTASGFVHPLLVR